MNKGFKTVWVCLFLGLSLSVAKNNQVFAEQNNNVEFSKIIDAFYSALRTVKNLNYYTDERIAFVVAGQEIAFDIGAGRGNIFAPLKSVPAKVNPTGFGFSSEDSDASLSGFTKVLIENEIYKNGKNIEILKWFIDFKLNPVQFFTFKFLTLLNTTSKDGDWARMMEEVFCLLFRLSQTDELDFIDKNKKLSTSLPGTLVAALKDNKFGLLDFVDDLWFVLVSDKHVGGSDASLRPVQVKGFVFRDETIATQVYDKFKDCAGSKLREDINAFIKPQGYGIVDFNDFIKFRSDVGNSVLGANKFAKTMVGYDEFILSQNTGKPADLILQAKALQAKALQAKALQAKALQAKALQAQGLNANSGLIFVSDDINGEYWVACVTDDMSFVNALKEVLLTVAKSFKEYLQIKKEIFNKFDDASLKYKAEFDAKEKARIAIEKFVRSEDGGQIFEQIKRDVALLVDSEVMSGQITQNQQERLTALEADLSKLEAQKTDQSKDLAKWQQVLALQYGKNVKDVQEKVEQIKLEVAKIDAQIADKQKEIFEINAKLGGTSASDLAKIDVDAIEKDKQKLVKLYKLLDDKKRSGGVPSEKLVSAIKIIEERIAKASIQPVVAISFDEKIVVREQVAKLLESKAKELNDYINSSIKNLDLINDLEDKVIQELLLDEAVSMQKIFVKQLELVAAQIRQDNADAKKLEVYRSAQALMPKSSDIVAKIGKLELAVGHILDNKNHEDFVAKIMLRESFLSEFVNDITVNADKFMFVKQRLENSMTQIFSNSTHFKDNAKLYRYLWRMLPFSWKSFLTGVGVTEQSFN